MKNSVERLSAIADKITSGTITEIDTSLGTVKLFFSAEHEAEFQNAYAFWRGYPLNTYLGEDCVIDEIDDEAISKIESAIKRLRKDHPETNGIYVSEYTLGITSTNPGEDEFEFVKLFLDDVLHLDNIDELMTTFRIAHRVMLPGSYSLEISHTLGTMIENGVKSNKVKSTALTIKDHEYSMIHQAIVSEMLSELE